MKFKLVLIVFISIFNQSFSNNIQVQSSLTNSNAGLYYKFIVQDFFLIINLISIVMFLQQELFQHLLYYHLILQQKQLISYNKKILFNQNFNLSKTLPSLGSYSNYTVDTTNNIIQLKFVNISQSSNLQINFTLANIGNPFVTTLYQTININVKNNISSIIDQGQISFIYNSSTFTIISNWNGQFQPGNVGTISNFTFTFKPDVWRNGKMSLTLGFNRFWIHSLQNTSTTNIISSSTKCQPTCIISSKSTFTQVQFSALTLDSNNSIILKIINILSPPTLQKIDSVSVTSYDTTYISTIQTGSQTVSSSKSNQLQSLAVSTSSQINQPISLIIQMTTSNVFGPNDTLNLYFGQQILASSINITFQNGIIPTYTSDIISKNQILFSTFTILSSSYSKMSFKITLQSALTQIRSSKILTGNKVSIKRNGYLYNQQSFSYSVLPIMYIYSTLISISTNFVNFNSTININLANLTQKFINGDLLIIRIPQQINVYAGSCIPLQCIGCLCSIKSTNQSTSQSIVTISNFPLQGVNTINLNLQIRNPINSGYNISLCHYDVTNYTIQCFKGQFPSVQQTTLASKIIVLNNNNDQVYSPANYTLTINLTDYDINPGYMLVSFQKNMYLVNSSIVICYVNNQPVCDISSYSTLDQLVIKISILDVSIKLYNVKIQNIRNPLSTQPFQFSLKVYSVYFDTLTNKFVQLKYYSADSTYYRVTKPFKLSNIFSSINPCQNGKLSTLSILLTNNSLPFDPKFAILIDNPQPTNISILSKTINQQILWNSTTMNISIQNYISLEPIGYSFLIKTIDLLYDIFIFDIVVQNCQPSSLGINFWKITGLLGDPGQLSFVYNNNKSIDYLVIQLPQEYSNLTQIQSNSLSISRLSPRIFKLTLSTSQPINVQIWNFTHLSKLSSFFRFTTYKTSSINAKDYLIDENSNTVNYNLTMISSCQFPCKLCSSSNISICLQCYSKQWTENYLLINGTCVSQCITGFYFSSTQLSCKKCNFTCLTCDESKCLTCIQYYYYLNGSCLTDCPDKYYPISITQTCSRCSYPCEKCVNTTLCITCISPLYLNSKGNCIQDCASNQYPINFICRKCQTPCQSCSQSLNNCTKCVDGYFFNQNKCVTVCPSPLVPSTVNKVCTTCISPCQNCSLTSTTCTSCQIPLKLYQIQCLVSCPLGYYESYIGNNSICTSCPTECSICNSQTNCSICAKSYKYFNNKCISICPLMYFSQIINSTTNLLLNGTQICNPCTNDNRCIKCQNQLQCELCSTGYYLLQKKCVSSCPVTMYQDSFSCKNCSTSCLYCVSSDICQICSSSTYLYQQKCILQCPTQTTWTEITKNISVTAFSNISTNYKTKICISCLDTFSNCLICTNISCTLCITNFVLDFDNMCKVKCTSGYINLNNRGFCVKCQSQCIQCVNYLNNCTTCSNGMTLYINGSDTNNYNMRQCLFQCPSNMIGFQGKCTNCQSPCFNCIDVPTKCLSCITSNITYYLFNSSCITECPSHFYSFQSSCQQCDIKCERCRKQGCLKCGSGYFTSQPFNMTSNDNTIGTYFYCYQRCPDNLPFVYENNICKKCSQKCLLCNLDKCLECETNYYIYGQYCINQCPLPLVNYSKSCVNPNDIPVPLITPNSTIVQQKIQAKYFSFPVPFSMVLIIILSLCLLSKCQYSSTHLSVSFYGVGSIICNICIIYYFITFLIKSSQTSSSIILLISLIINYVQNSIFLILTKFTLLSDESFYKFTISHKQYLILFLIGFCTSHTNYILFFSKLFDMSIFKVYLQNLNYLKILNYLWYGQIIIYLLGWISGIVRLSSVDRFYFTFSQTLEHFYQCLDIIIVCFVMFLMSILNFKKPKSIYLRQDDFVSTQSTKKVIFDQSSNQNFNDLNDFQSRQQFNIRGKNFKIANQQILFDKLIFPEESGNKFLFQQQSYSNNNQNNYDDIFIKNHQIYSNINENKLNRNQLTATKDQFLQTALAQKISNNNESKLNKKKYIIQNFSVSNTINLHLKQNQMGQQLQNIPVVNDEQELQNNRNQVIFQNRSGIYYHRQALKVQGFQDILQNQSLSPVESQKQASLSKVVEQPQQQQIALNCIDQGQQTIDQKFILQMVNNQRQISVQPTRVEYSINQNQGKQRQQNHKHNSVGQIEQINQNQIQNSNLNKPLNIQSAQNLKKKSLKNSTKSINSPKKSPTKSLTRSPPKNYIKSTQITPKIIEASPKRFNNSSLSLKKNISQIHKKQQQQIGKNTKNKSLQKSLNKDTKDQKMVKPLKQSGRKRYQQNNNKQKSLKKQNNFIPGHLFSTKNYRQRYLQPRISGIGVLFNSFMEQNSQKHKQQNNISSKKKQQISNKIEQNFINNYKNSSQENKIQNKSNQQIQSYKNIKQTIVKPIINSNIKSETYQQNINQMTENQLKDSNEEKHLYINQIQQYCLKPQQTIQMIDNKRNNSKTIINKVYKNMNINDVNQKLQYNKKMNKIQKMNNSKEKSEQSYQQQQDTKFYLNDDIKNQKNNRMDKSSNNRRSKSYSPNSFNRIGLTHKQDPRYRQNIRISKKQQEISHISKSKLSNNNNNNNKQLKSSKIIKPIQIDVIDYDIKNNNKNRFPKKSDNKQDLSNIITEIQRKQKIKSRSKQLQNIYGNKIIINNNKNN